MVKIRETIQITTYLCVALSFTSAAVSLDTYHLVGFLFLLLCSIFFDYRRIIEIPRWLLNGLSLLILFLAITRVTPETLIEPILDALIILAVIKLLERKKFRDYMQIYVICMFLLVGSTLVSFSITFLLYLSAFLTLVTISLILLAYFIHDPEMVLSRKNLRKVVYQSMLIFVLSVPLSMLLFVILPRTAYPFLNFLNRDGFARSGFTDSVSLGEVAGIQEDNTVIFRAVMPQVDESRLYWRGVVLDEFDGTKWTAGEHMEEHGGSHPGDTQEIVQTIYLEPYGNKYLFALDRPISFSIYRNKHSRARIYPFKSKIFERIRYQASSQLAPSFMPAMVERSRYLQLPADFSPRLRELVRGLTSEKSQEEQVKTLFYFVQRGDYRYSLEDLPVSQNPLEDFLLVHKRGNCEYFASSLAVMLRIAGIPARLVGGYKGGYYNSAGNYYLLTQQNAHVWIEAYLPAHGWLKLDPTPPLTEFTWNRMAGRLLLHLRLILDTFNYYWYKVIIDYDFTKQIEIVNAVRERMSRPAGFKLHLDTVTLRKNLIVLALLIVIPLLCYTLIKSYKRREERILSRFLNKMASFGYERKKHEGLEELLQRVEEDEVRGRAEKFVEDFEQVYYRDQEFTRATVQRLKRRISRI